MMYNWDKRISRALAKEKEMENVCTQIRVASLTVGLLVFSLITFTSANGQGPAGSYKDTCRAIQVFGTTVTAQCQRADGSWKNTALKTFTDCEGDISNQNGDLTCKRGFKPGKQLPNGSYKQSCKDSSVEGKWLYSKCKRTNGNWNNTSLKYKDCNKDIWNNNGVLTCGGGNSNLPRGSYKQTCKDAYVDGNWLYAKCKKNNGSWFTTTLKYSNCNKDIWNNNGILTCGGGGGGSGKLPSGSYKQTCKNAYVEGNVLEADCLNSNGKCSRFPVEIVSRDVIQIPACFRPVLNPLETSRRVFRLSRTRPFR